MPGATARARCWLLAAALLVASETGVARTAPDAGANETSFPDAGTSDGAATADGLDSDGEEIGGTENDLRGLARVEALLAPLAANDFLAPDGGAAEHLSQMVALAEAMASPGTLRELVERRRRLRRDLVGQVVLPLWSQIRAEMAEAGLTSDAEHGKEAPVLTLWRRGRATYQAAALVRDTSGRHVPSSLLIQLRLGVPEADVWLQVAGETHHSQKARPVLHDERLLRTLVRAVATILETCARDSDGDGLSDRLEQYNRSLGLDPGRFDRAVVAVDLACRLAHACDLGTVPQERLLFGIRLPGTGPGYYHYRGSDRPDTDNYGSITMVRTLDTVTREWFGRHPFGPSVGVGDLSRAQGGTFRPHSSHKGGQDVDLRYLVTPDGYPRVDFSHRRGRGDYDQDRTQELVDMLLARAGLVMLLVDGRSGILDTGDSGRLQVYRGHHHHMHVRFR